MKFRTAVEIWNCRERIFTSKIVRWDGQKWNDIPVVAVSQFKHRITSFGWLHEGDVVAVHERTFRRIYQVKRYRNLFGEAALTLVPVDEPAPMKMEHV